MEEGKKWFVIDFYDFVYSIFLLLIVFHSLLVGSLDASTGWLAWDVLVGGCSEEVLKEWKLRWILDLWRFLEKVS
jgi:hypothetical protein